MYLKSRSPMNQWAVLKCRFNFSQLALDTMRPFRNGFRIFLMKILTAFFILSLIYHLLTAFMTPCPFVVLGITRDFFDSTLISSTPYHLLHFQLPLVTLFGLNLGAILGAILCIILGDKICILLNRPWRPPPHAELRCLFLGILFGAAIGAFLIPLPIRWFLWYLPYQFYVDLDLLQTVLPGFSFYIDRTYFFWLTNLLMLAFLFSISTKSRSTTPATYRFGCRN